MATITESAASYLAMNNPTTLEIAEILGHKTLQMVKRYALLSAPRTRGVIERMNEKIFDGELGREEDDPAVKEVAALWRSAA